MRHNDFTDNLQEFPLDQPVFFMITAELKHNMAEHTFNPPYALFMGLTSAPLSGKFMGAGPEVTIST